MHPDIESYVRNIEERRLPDLRNQLAELESGRMRLGESKRPGEWVDTTQEYARRLRDLVAEFEDIVATLKAGLTP
jgi:hypothetical protein